MTCPHCGRQTIEAAHFCSHCGTALPPSSDGPGIQPGGPADLNLPILYGMAAALVLALVFPPWETPPSEVPAFLGLRPFWAGPTPTAVVSKMLLTIETMTIAIAGIYLAWLFRGK